MSSITFNSLKPVSKNVQKYTYADIALDIQQQPTGINDAYTGLLTTSKDMKVALDLNAIRNSLTNLFNTSQGERFLLPDYGSDLRRYIFEPISDMNGTLIGRSIHSAIVRWEPRIKVQNIDVRGYIDQQEYDIQIAIRVPLLNQPLYLKGILNRQGYVFS